MILSKKKKPAAASSVVSGEALGMDANIAMLVKERNANNAWHKLARNKTALVGFFIVAFMVVIAVFAPLIAPYDPNAINPVLPFKGIGTPGHLFGTDDLGRDILSRIIYGSRISMIVAVGATIVGAIIGAAIMGVLRNGLVLLDVSAYWQQTVIGAVIILAVALDNLRHMKKKA